MKKISPSLMRGAWTAVLVVGAVLAWWLSSSGNSAGDGDQGAKQSVKRQHRNGMISAQKRSFKKEDQQQALENLMSGKPFVLVADGRAQRYSLSLSELYVTTAPTDNRLRQIDPQPDAQHLIQTAEKLGGNVVGWVLYPEGREGVAQSRQILHKRIHLQTINRTATLAALKRHGLRLLSEPDYAPGSMIVEPVNGGPEATLAALAALGSDESTAQVGPLLMRQHVAHFTPNDSLFTQQWHLKNTGQGGSKIGVDMHVSTVWDTYKGQDIKIAIVDDGLDLLHPDLSPNADSANHYDWNDSPPDTNPAPVAAFHDDHGTAVGGVAAARGNNSIGVSGVAPEATLVGFRLISSATDDSEDADAMSRGEDVIHIKNCSWGAGALANETIPAGPLMEAARRSAAETGRGGLGTVFVWSAGNGRDDREQGQKDGSTNSMFITTVGAVTNTGALTVYSETGSHLVVVAPSNGGSRAIYSTDLRGADGYNQKGTSEGEPADLNYTSSFGGTSSAAPAISGAVALMLQANPNLNWRDVKEILLRSSVKIFPTDAGWVSRNGGSPGLPLIKHHQSYGGGQVDTQAAVTMATTWTGLGPMIEDSRTSSTVRSIPDNNTTGINVVFDFSTMDPMRIEHATLQLNLWHGYRGDIELKLTSPTGSVSTLATKEGADDGIDYDDWVFSSVRHWGESAKGLWTLSIKDLSAGDTGTFRSATLTLFGTSAEPALIVSQTASPLLIKEGDPLSLNVQATGGGTLNYAWSQNGKSLTNTSATFSAAAANASHAGDYLVTVSNLGGSDTSDTMSVGVVNRTQPSLTLNQGTKLNLTATAAGPGLSYLWLRDGQPIPDASKVVGTATKTLSISDVQSDEAGDYTCVIGMAGTPDTIETLPATISVRLKPVVTPPPFTNGVISGVVNTQFTADNAATKFTATGLPSGVTLNLLGLLSGRPTRIGNYKMLVTASNLAGNSPPVQIDWQVEDFPLSARGTWNGLVERHSSLNAGFGGRLSITVASTGTYTGLVTLGAKSYAWSSRIDALAGNANPTTPFSISRGTLLTPLAGSFTLDLPTGTLTGSISDGANQASLSAARNSWSAIIKPVPVTTVHNAALEVPAGFVGTALYPQGHGHTTLTLGTTGTVIWAGKLADATTLTGSTTLGPAGQASIHAMLYANTGSTQGWSTVTLATGLVDGSLSWVKAPQPVTSTTRSYKDGIPLHTLTVRGARYTRPAIGSMIIGLDPQPATGPLINNARLHFTGPPLTPTLDQLFQVTKANTAIMPTLLTVNPQSVRITLNATTGTMTGTFAFSDNDPFDFIAPIAKILRSATYSGLLITRPDLTQGVGFFNLAELPDVLGEKSTATPVVSGKAELVRP
jgi:subtilisin-like proprotein convertase family protein